MKPFFQEHFNSLVDSPNQSQLWWHSLFLPNGDRINGRPQDKDLQFKMWRAMQIANKDGLAGKRVLDIGANDGFFTVAAFMAGAQEVTAIDAGWGTWPQNIQYASQVWNVTPKIITADFRIYDFAQRYDVIFFLGVLYDLEDVFECMIKLGELLEAQGTIYIETQMSQVQSELPIFEYASDIYTTIARQDKKSLSGVGISNYLFPMSTQCATWLTLTTFGVNRWMDHKIYIRKNPTRRLFAFTRQSDRSA